MFLETNLVNLEKYFRHFGQIFQRDGAASWHMGKWSLARPRDLWPKYSKISPKLSRFWPKVSWFWPKFSWFWRKLCLSFFGNLVCWEPPWWWLLNEKSYSFNCRKNRKLSKFSDEIGHSQSNWGQFLHFPCLKMANQNKMWSKCKNLIVNDKF